MSKPDANLDQSFTGMDAVLAGAVQQLTNRIQRGEVVDEDFIQQHFTDHQAILIELLPTIQALTELHEAGGPAENVGLGRRDAVGDFEILREVGRGGMGIVYEARQKSLDRKVALKVLPFAALLDSRQLQRFKNEARAAAMLKHPNVVSVYSVGCDRGVHYYAMEMIEGISLSTLIAQLSAKRRPPQPKPSDDCSENDVATHENEASIETQPIAEISTLFTRDRSGFYRSVARLGAQAAEALHFAHQEGIVHRDIKPSNLLLDRDGTLHLADFGLAQIQSSDQLTKTGDFVGTLRYMSPEQLDGERIVDRRTDVYSLGLTLMELSTGRSAVGGDNRKEILTHILEGRIQTPSQTENRFPKDLETVLLKATHREADCRFHTAKELAEELGRYEQGLPILSRPITSLERCRVWIRRNRNVAALLAISSLFLLVLGIGGPLMALKQRDTAQQNIELAATLRQQLYDTTIQSAAALVAGGDFEQAEEILAPFGASDLRGFEWHHLSNQCKRILNLPNHYHWAPRYAIDYSPTNDLVAWCSWDAGVGIARVATLETLWQHSNNDRRISNSKAHTDIVNDVLFINDGAFVASGSRDGTVRIWNSQTGEVVSVIDGLGTSVLCLAANEKKRIIAAGIKEEFESHGATTARIELYEWEANAAALSCSRKRTINVPHPIISISISQDGRYVAAADGKSPTPLLWELESGKADSKLPQNGAVSHVCFSPFDPTVLALGIRIDGQDDSVGIVRLVDLEASELNRRILVHQRPISSVSFDHSGKQLVCSSDDGFLFTASAENTDDVTRLRLDSHRVYDANACRESRFVLATMANGRLCRVPKALDRSVERLAGGSRGGAAGLSMSQQGHLVAAFGDGMCMLWDPISIEPQFTLSLGVEHAFGASISHDGKYAAFAGGEWPDVGFGKIKIIRVSGGHELLEEIQTSASAWSVQFSPNGELLAATDGPSIRMWRIPALSELPSLKVLSQQAAMRKVKFSADGRFIVAVDRSYPSKAFLWDIETGQHISTIRSDVGANAIGFSPSADQIVLAAHNGDLQMFDVKSQKLIRTIGNHPRTLMVLEFSPDGRRLISAGWNGEVRLWNTATATRLMTWNVEGPVWSASFSPNGETIAFDDTSYEHGKGFVRKLGGRPSGAQLSPRRSEKRRNTETSFSNGSR